MSTESQMPDRAAGRCGSLLVALVLLVCVTAVLAGLWVRERNLRNDAERRYVELPQLMQDRLQQAGPGAILLPDLAARGSAEPIQRSDLPGETVELQGRTRALLRIGASAGRRLGFLPGDVVVVADESASAPAGESGS